MIQSLKSFKERN